MRDCMLGLGFSGSRFSSLITFLANSERYYTEFIIFFDIIECIYLIECIFLRYFIIAKHCWNPIANTRQKQNVIFNPTCRQLQNEIFFLSEVNISPRPEANLSIKNKFCNFFSVIKSVVPTRPGTNLRCQNEKAIASLSYRRCVSGEKRKRSFYVIRNEKTSIRLRRKKCVKIDKVHTLILGVSAYDLYVPTQKNLTF